MMLWTNVCPQTCSGDMLVLHFFRHFHDVLNVPVGTATLSLSFPLIFIFLLILTEDTFCIDFEGEGGKERERDINVETHWLPSAHALTKAQGWILQPTYVPLTGI